MVIQRAPGGASFRDSGDDDDDDDAGVDIPISTQAVALPGGGIGGGGGGDGDSGDTEPIPDPVGDPDAPPGTVGGIAPAPEPEPEPDPGDGDDDAGGIIGSGPGSCPPLMTWNETLGQCVAGPGPGDGDGGDDSDGDYVQDECSNDADCGSGFICALGECVRTESNVDTGDGDGDDGGDGDGGESEDEDVSGNLVMSSTAELAGGLFSVNGDISSASPVNVGIDAAVRVRPSGFENIGGAIDAAVGDMFDAVAVSRGVVEDQMGLNLTPPGADQFEFDQSIGHLDFGAGQAYDFEFEREFEQITIPDIEGYGIRSRVADRLEDVTITVETYNTGVVGDLLSSVLGGSDLTNTHEFSAQEVADAFIETEDVDFLPEFAFGTPSFDLPDSIPDSPSALFGVSIPITNEGGGPGDFEVVGDLPGLPVSDSLDPGETYNLDLEPSIDRLGEFTTISISGTGESTTIDFPSPGDEGGTGIPVFEVTRVFAVPPDSPGGVAVVEIDVTNTGEGTGTAALAGPLGDVQSTEISPGGVFTFRFTLGPEVFGESITFEPESDHFENPVNVDIPLPPLPEFRLGFPDISLPDPQDLPAPAEIDIPVTNTGSEDGEPTLAGPGGLTDTRPVGQGETRNFEFDVAPQFFGQEATFSLEEYDASRSIEIPEPSEEGVPEFIISNISAPSEIQPGEGIPVDITIQNIGDAIGDVAVELNPTQTASIEPGEQERFSFDLSPDAVTDGSLSANVVDETAGETAVEESIPVSVLEPPQFDITNITPPEPSPFGGGLVTNFDVTNTGGTIGDVVASAPGFSQTQTISPGETRSFEYEFVPDSFGNITRDITIANEQTGEEQTESVQAEVEDPSFAITSVDAPDSVSVGSSYDVTVLVENTTGTEGAAGVTIADVERTLTIPPGETRQATVTRTLQTPEQEETTIEVSSEQSGEVSDTESVSVSPALPEFELGGIEFPDILPIGEPAQLTVPVTNVGDGAGRATVDVAGTTHSTGTIQPGGTEDILHTLSLDDTTPQELPISVLNEATDETDDSTTERTEGDFPEFTIRSVDLPTFAAPGEVMQGEAEIANDGQGAGRGRLEAGLQEQTIRLDPGDTRTVSFTTTKSPQQNQNVRVEIHDLTRDIDPDVHTETVRLQEPDEPPEPDLPVQPPAPGDDDLTVEELFTALLDPLGILGLNEG